MNLKVILLNIYVFFLLVFSTYQDFPLFNKIGELGKTPIILLVPIFIFIEFLLIIKKKTQITKLQKYLLFLTIYMTIISLVYVLISFFTRGYVFLGEDILFKSLRGLVYFIVIFFYVRHVYFVFTTYKNQRKLIAPFLVFCVFLLLIMILEYLQVPNAFSYLHSNSIPYYRIRLLTFESSWTGTIIIVSSSILFYLTSTINSKVLKCVSNILNVTLLISYILLTGSKGFLLTLFLIPIYFFIKSISFSKKSFGFMVMTPVLFTLLYIILKDQLIQSILIDIEQYTSIATRLGTVLAAILTVVQNPFGVGTGAYLIHLPENTSKAIFYLHSWFSSFGIQLNYDELYEYNKTAQNLGVKSGVFHWFMLGGIGTVFFFYFISKYLFSIVKGNNTLTISLLLVIFAVTSYINFEIKYEIWLLFSFIESIKKKDLN